MHVLCMALFALLFSCDGGHGREGRKKIGGVVWIACTSPDEFYLVSESGEGLVQGALRNVKKSKNFITVEYIPFGSDGSDTKVETLDLTSGKIVSAVSIEGAFQEAKRFYLKLE